MTRYVDSGGTQIAWEEHGSGEPLLLVMGHRWSRRMWHPVLDGLAERFRVIAFDNRGAGESGCPEPGYPLSQMTDDAVSVMQAAGVDSAHVFGVSMGGVIAADLAIAHPDRVRRLVLGCTGAVTADRLRLTPGRRVNYYLPDRVVNALGRPLLYGGFQSTPAIKHDLAMLANERTTRRGLLGQAYAIDGYGVDLADLRSLPHPTLVLHGGKDKVMKAEWGRELAELIPGARLQVYEDAGHNFFATHGTEAVADVTAFLEA